MRQKRLMKVLTRTATMRVRRTAKMRVMTTTVTRKPIMTETKWTMPQKKTTTTPTS